jgi:aspartyl-tRNA(Asn)/glutamyl-tRNA(Gln) amidotransferase subunit B
MPELPTIKKDRFKTQYKLNDYDIDILTNNRELSEYFEKTIEDTDLNPKTTANWIITEVLALANKKNLRRQQSTRSVIRIFRISSRMSKAK